MSLENHDSFNKMFPNTGLGVN